MTRQGLIPDVVTLGIDEAGRGPVLGPMVLAGVALRPRAAAAMTRVGVADSKSFGAGYEAHLARCALAVRILEVAESTVVRVVDVAEVDRRTAFGQLNVLEREEACAIISASASADRIIADGARLFGPLCSLYPNLVTRNHAEAYHVAVAAASILAKVRRDELWLCIVGRYEPEFGPISGGGYQNAGTYRFLRAYVDRHGRLPPEARRSWSCAAAMLQPELPGLGIGERIMMKRGGYPEKTS